MEEKYMDTTPGKPLTRSELRNFGLILAAGIIVFFGLLFPLMKGGGIRPLSWPWLSALVLAAISLTIPGVLRPLHRAWMFVGGILGYINTRIILGIIYLAIFTPISILFKLLGKDHLRRTYQPGAKSYRIDSRQPQPENLTRPY